MPRPGRPVVWLLGGYVAGLVAARLLPIGPDPFWPGVIAFTEILLLGALAWWLIDWRFEARWARAATVTRLVPPLVAVAAFGLGAISLSAELRPRLRPDHLARQVEEAGGRLRATVEGRVVNVEPARGSGAAILLDAEAVEVAAGARPASGRVLVRVERGVVEGPSPGDRLRFTASLRLPRSFRNPGGYDARSHLALRQVRVVGAVRDYAEVTRVERGGFRVRTLLEAPRNRVRGALEAAVRGPAAELLRAIVLGEQEGLPRHVEEAFQATGTFHVVTVSGLHMALVAAAAFGLALALGARLAPRFWPAADVRKGAALAALAPVLFYMVLAGAGIAAVRAALMAAAVLVALALGRRLDLWSALALAALLLLAFYPAALFELGFLLSFGAMIAILRLSPWLADLAGIRDLLAARGARSRPGRLARRAGAWVAGSIAVSAAAGLGTGPLLALAFGRVTPWAPLANLLVVPVVGGVAVGLGLAGAAVALVHPPWAAPLFRADAALLEGAIALTQGLAAWPGASLRVPAPSGWEIGLAYLALWLLPAAWPPGGRTAPDSPPWGPWAARMGVLGVAVCLLVAGAVRAWPPPAGTLRMTFLDVGTGETALLELPEGQRILIDGGAAYEGGFDVGERVVVPFLMGRGVRRLDLLVLSQPLPDRLGGLAAIARAFPIGAVWVPPSMPQVRGDLGLALADRRVPILVRRPDDPPERFGPVEVMSLPGHNRVAFRLLFGEVAVIYPPDGPGTPPPAHWLPPEAGPLAGFVATVLHWPRSALPVYGVGPLLDGLAPTVVIVAGEPGRRALREIPELLDVIEIRGARALVPERDGAVVVTTDGRGLEVRTMDPSVPLEEGL